VGEVLADRGAQMALAEKNELVEALALDGTDEALGVCVEVGTARRQADRGDASGRKKGSQLRGVERVAFRGVVNRWPFVSMGAECQLQNMAPLGNSWVKAEPSKGVISTVGVGGPPVRGEPMR
jgi:hypothetical protein